MIDREAVISRCLLTFLFVIVGISALCCSDTSENSSRAMAATPEMRNSNEIANLSNANANMHLYGGEEAEPWRSKAVDVSANVQWLDTGLDLKKGQNFMIVTSGQWSVGNYASGAIGTLRECKTCIVPEAYLGELVARIGEEAFVIGDRMQMRSPEEGRVYLSTNDVPGSFKDNSGSIEARIAYGKPPEAR